MVKQVPKFDKNCESFRNFDDGIRRDTTRRNYHYSLDELVRFGGFFGYDSLVKLDIDETHDLLKRWIRSMKERDLSYKAAKTKLNAPELFFDMNKKVLYKKLLHKMLPDSDQLPTGDTPFTTEDLWQMKQAAKKPRDIAVIDFLASTGIRPGSISDPVLRLKHLKEMPQKCMAVKVYGDSKEWYWAFLTPEAASSLRRYLASRTRNGEQLDDESILFKNYENPNKKNDWLDANSIRQMLTSVIKYAGIERKKTKNRYDKPIVYGFRKRFNTILKLNNNVNFNIAEKLMAHKRGLDGVYLTPTLEECFIEFEKAIQDLTIDPTERQKTEIKKLEQEQSDAAKNKKELSTNRQIIDELATKDIKLEEISKRLEKVEYGNTARDNVYYKNMLNVQGDTSAGLLLTMVYLWFEMSASENEKRKIWKKINQKGGGIFDLMPFIENKKPSLKNWHSVSTS